MLAKRCSKRVLLRARRRRPLCASAPATPEASPAACAGIGCLGGAAGAMVGLGGGFVVIPLLVGAARFTQHQAHGTSLAAVAATSLVGAATYGSEGAVDYQAAAGMSVAAILTVSLGARSAGRISNASLKRLMGAFMLAVAPMVPLKEPILAFLQPAAAREDAEPGVTSERRAEEWAALFGVGALTGFVSGLLGVGGGSVMTPALSLSSDLSHHAVIGTSLASMVIPSCVGTLQHHRLGNVVLKAAVPLALGTAAGAFIGARFALWLPEEELKWFFGAMMLVLGAKQIR